MKPPMTPKDAKKSPSSSVTTAGMIVWYGRFRGARQFAWPSSNTKL